MPAPVPAADAAPVAVLGECVADAFVRPPATEVQTPAIGLDVLPGGGPANTAVALARLATPTRFLGRLSGDVFGRLFRDHLTRSGVDLTRTVAAREPSTLAVADVDEDGRADYSFHAENTADFQWTPRELAAASDGPLSCLHTGSLATVLAPGRASVEDLVDREHQRRRATISYDPNVRPALLGTPEEARPVMKCPREVGRHDHGSGRLVPRADPGPARRAQPDREPGAERRARGEGGAPAG